VSASPPAACPNTSLLASGSMRVAARACLDAVTSAVSGLASRAARHQSGGLNKGGRLGSPPRERLRPQLAIQSKCKVFAPRGAQGRLGQAVMPFHGGQGRGLSDAWRCGEHGGGRGPHASHHRQRCRRRLEAAPGTARWAADTWPPLAARASCTHLAAAEA
jgi:hypothetical protein